ncbi:MAG: hypothetical protein ACYC5Q_08095 [Thermoleophilia bacterium]
MTGFRNIFRVSERLEDGAVQDDARLEDALNDPALAALAAELGSLGDAPVPPSARQRGLVQVRQEFEWQEKRGVFGPVRGTGLLFRGRLALGSIAVVLAAFLGLVGLYGGGNAPQWTGSTAGSGPVTPGTSGPDGSGSTVTSTPISDSTDTSVVVTPAPDGTTVPTLTSTTETGSTLRPPASTGSTMRPPSSSTSTSQPTDPTSTTGRAVLTRTQRESSAKFAAMSLSEKVVLNDREGAADMLASSAGPGFVQLVSSLEAPYVSSVISVATTDGPNTRVLVEFLDRVTTDQGTAEVALRFYYEMRVDASGALVTAIYKAP